jgi:hypothetical protein
VVTSGCDPGTPNTGPSTDVSPYVVPTAPGAEIKALWTVGDPATEGRRMVGIPDGLGVLPAAGGTVTAYMNHELNASAGIVRAHARRAPSSPR